MSMTFREAVEYYNQQGITRIQPGTPEYENVLKMAGMQPDRYKSDIIVKYAAPGESRQPLNAPPMPDFKTKALSKLEWLKISDNRAKFNAHIKNLKTTS